MKKENFLAKNLHFLRVSRKLKQHEIQDHIGIRRNTWSNWENKKSEPSLDLIFKIALYFNTDVGRLITVDLEKEKYGAVKNNAEGIWDEVVNDHEKPYATRQCTRCDDREEVIGAQKVTINALQGQVEALQAVISGLKDGKKEQGRTE